MNLIILNVLCFVGMGRSAKILGVFPSPSISHQIVYRPLMQELAKRGHEIVVITPDPVQRKDKLSENYLEIDIHNKTYNLAREFMKVAFANYGTDLNNPRTMLEMSQDWIFTLADAIFTEPQVENLIKDQTISFDLVILESFTQFALGFVHRFKAPYIGISSAIAMPKNFEDAGSPANCLLYTSLFGVAPAPSDFWGKIDTLHTDIYLRYLTWKNYPKYTETVRKYFGTDMPTIDYLERNYDLLFMNLHPLISGVRPTVPAIVYLGSMHIQPKKELPQIFKDFLDNSEHGVIYFSFGSNVLSKNLPPALISIFIETFRELPFDVLWKYEDETLPGKPSNVFISKWVPQQDILGHPKIKAFITQGGQQSMEEAIHSEVPLIGIPFFGDQPANVQIMVNSKIGIRLKITEITKESLKSAILEITGNKSYKQNIAKLSVLIRDEPQTPLERAVWWTEYVLRHRGAAHLRAPAAGLPWYHYFMLDVVGALLGAVLACSTLVILILRRICCTKPSKKIKKS